MTASPNRADLLVRPAVDGILAAFETHPLVGLGDRHGLADEGAFYNQLISDPRFADEVGNVVVEFGSASHQNTLDRYLAGEDVAYSDLRRVWLDAVGWEPTIQWSMYQLFFAQVRRTNLGLPLERRIRVWLGDPPADWSTIHTSEDLAPYILQRETHPASLIEREILSAGKKALVIYGGRHLLEYADDMLKSWPQLVWLRTRVEETRPGAFYVVTVHVGFPDPRHSAAFEAEFNWPNATLVSAVGDTSLKSALAGPGWSFDAEAAGRDLPGYKPLSAELHDILMGVAGDALLYLGPARTLMTSPYDPSLVMDGALFAELSRRATIKLGSSARPADWVAEASRPPRAYARW